MAKVNLTAATLVPGLQGPCTLQKSAADCTRCNSCVQSCPVYLLHPQETNSPRGRTQLVHLLCQGKISLEPDDPLLKEIAFSCILCARCTAACAGQIPVAHHTLALRDGLEMQPLPDGLRILFYIRRKWPGLFHFFVSAGLLLHRLKLGILLRPILPKWTQHAQAILPAKTGSLCRLLRRQKITVSPDKPKAVYLPSLYAQYVDPQAGLLVYNLVKTKNLAVLFNQQTGLFEYLYGRRKYCLQTAKKLLLTWEKYSASRPLPLITDSIEQYAFLKNYPLLFEKISGWKQRAELFAKHVQFIADLPFPTAKKTSAKRVALDNSALLYPVPEQTERARKILLASYGKNLLQCAYSSFPLPAGSIGFARGNEINSLLYKHIQDMARQQIDVVFCLSAWAALELNAMLPMHYPSAEARFFIYAGADQL